MRRPSAKFYPGVGEDCILPVAANAGTSKLTAQGASWNEHRRLGPLMVNPTPNMRAARRLRGHDLELVRRGFSHRSNWMSIAGNFALLSGWGIV